MYVRSVLYNISCEPAQFVYQLHQYSVHQCTDASSYAGSDCTHIHTDRNTYTLTDASTYGISVSSANSYTNACSDAVPDCDANTCSDAGSDCWTNISR